MKQKIALFASALITFSIATDAVAMAYEPIKLFVYKRGESIGGEEFIAANETVMDYLATLKRPTDPLKGIKYNCQAKGQYIRPSVWQNNAGTNNYAYVDIRTVYDLKDCTAAVVTP